MLFGAEIMTVRTVDEIFRMLSFDETKLATFGFVEKNGVYQYCRKLADGQFEAVVKVADSRLCADVIDCETGDIYALVKAPQAEGVFVGELRKEFEALLDEVAAKCCFSDVFKSVVAKKAIAYARNKYGDELEFLWQKLPDCAILRRKDTQKWYAAFLTVGRNKIGLTGKEKIEIIDLRVRSEDIEQLVDGENYFKGYHMNKKHWITICLDGRTMEKEVFRRIDESYVLAVK